MSTNKDMVSKKAKINRILVGVIVLLLVVAISAVTYAAWSDKLEAENVFTVKSAEVTHLTFGGEGGVAIDKLTEPGGIVSSPKVKIVSSNENLKVRFAIITIDVKLDGADAYLPIEAADNGMFTLSVSNADDTITKQGVDMVFNFTMKKIVDQKYSQASFKITVSATATKA